MSWSAYLDSGHRDDKGALQSPIVVTSSTRNGTIDLLAAKLRALPPGPIVVDDFYIEED